MFTYTWQEACYCNPDGRTEWSFSYFKSASRLHASAFFRTAYLSKDETSNKTHDANTNGDDKRLYVSYKKSGASLKCGTARTLEHSNTRLSLNSRRTPEGFG